MIHGSFTPRQFRDSDEMVLAAARKWASTRGGLGFVDIDGEVSFFPDGRCALFIDTDVGSYPADTYYSMLGSLTQDDAEPEAFSAVDFATACGLWGR